MISRRLERAAWLGSLLLLVGAGGVALQGARRDDLLLSESAALPAIERFPAESVNAWARATVQRDPFRLERRPAALRFGETPPLPPDPARPSRPELVLLGITGGPPWQAIVAGIPGRTTSVVLLPGEALAGFVARRVTSDSAIISGMDTTWTLTLRKPGQ